MAMPQQQHQQLPRGAVKSFSQQQPQHQQVFRGVLKSFAQKEGYGFLSCPVLYQCFGGDVFVEGSKLPPGSAPGSMLEFALRLSSTGQPQALWTTLLETQVPGSASSLQLANNLADPVEALDTGLLQFLTHQTNTYSIIVEKRNKNAKLGIDVDTTHSHALIVDAVSGGMTEDWNRENPEMDVKPGDSMVEVNGVIGDASVMLNECRNSQRLHVVFSRPSDSSSPPMQAAVGGMPTVYVVSWNVLAGASANPERFPDVDPGVFNEARRRKQAAAALRHLAADVVCLQGVDCPLEELGLGSGSEYDSCTVQRPSGQLERCVIAWRRAKFEVGPAGHQMLFLDKHPPPAALVSAECDATYFRTGSAGLAVELRMIEDPGRRCLTVATTQLAWEAARADVFAWQLHKFADMVAQFAGPRVLICGDLSWPPGSQPYEFLSQGIGLESAYRSCEGNCFTCSRGLGGFATMCDYIWFDPKWMICQKRIELLRSKELVARSGQGNVQDQQHITIPSFLSEAWPSDHLVVGSIFELTNPAFADEWE